MENAWKCKKDKKHLTRARDCINFAANLAGTAFHVASVTIMTKKRSTRISTFGSQLTSIISVALVLMILGVLALTTIAGSRGVDMLRGNLGYIVRMVPGAPDADVNRMKQTVISLPSTASFVYSSAEDILASESEYIGDDITELIDVNPYSAEFDVKVTPANADADSIAAIVAALEKLPSVETVDTEAGLVNAINATVKRLTLIMLLVAAVFLVVSVVLIYNTVHLAIYSRRFIIYTMRLVGATGSFVRRPFIVAGVVNGLIAALVAVIAVIAVQLYAGSLDALVAEALTFTRCLPVYAGIIVAGVAICATASALATNRYLRSDYDDMFMK